MRDALLLFAEEKSESEGERVSLGRGIKINRNTSSSEDRYRNRVIRPSLSFRGGKKKRKKKQKQSANFQSTKSERRLHVNKNDLRKRTLAERPAKDNCWCSNARKRGERVGQSSRPRVARAFSKSTKKNFSYHHQEREGTTARFLPLIHRAPESRPKKKK